MNTAILSEVSRDIPSDIPARLTRGGRPMFTAYGCVLLETETDSSFVYRAVNLKSGRSVMLSRRANSLTDKGIAAMVEKIRLSPIAGAGRLEIDRPYGESLIVGKLREILDAIFRDILPQHGYCIREQQIELAGHILDTIAKRQLTLAEAEVGTGKTLAYLLAAICVKRGRVNDFWNSGLYPDMSYVDMAHMPIVISTSSIALQNALIRDFIPNLSKILMAHHIIKTPLTAVLRKGKEHYICGYRLRAHFQYERNRKMKRRLKRLLEPSAPIDLSEIDGLTPHVKRKISVPRRCPTKCPQRSICRYQMFLDRVRSSETDIQVCNHNYILADTKLRSEGKKPLIPNYQCLIIDEAHKFLQAARQIYGIELSSLMLAELSEDVEKLFPPDSSLVKPIRNQVHKLSGHSGNLFRVLNEGAEPDDSEDDAERRAALIGKDVITCLRKIQEAAKRLSNLISSENTPRDYSGSRRQVLWELERLRDTITAFTEPDELIYWLENDLADDDGEMKLRAIPKDLDRILFQGLWFKGFPVVLTSGTLSANNDFSRIKQTLGLDRAGNRLTEISKASPFNHRDNTLLYISENMPFPDIRNSLYIDAITDETEKLIRAAHGHTAVLFTSYKVMDIVFERIAARGLPFPLFRQDRKNTNAIERFKRSGNGVLFASGAMWEGVDIPGDTHSMLIIVKLPFAVPDPIGQYERTLYDSMDDYKYCVITPDMQLRLKQGGGRLTRLVTDTGVIAILDFRASLLGAYREYSLMALPPCLVTSDIGDVEQFYLDVKTPEYFLLPCASP